MTDRNRKDIHPMRSLKRMLSLGVAALLAASVAVPATAQDAPSQLRIAIGADEGTLTPYTYVFGNPGFDLLHMVYDSLLTLDQDNVPQPWLVEDDAEISDDGLEYTFTLRDDVTWHDGEPLTSDDVAFTYNFYLENPAGAGRFSSALAPLEDIEVDGNTIVLRLSEPAPDFLILPLADAPILPEHVWSQIDDPEESDADIGSGPYRLTEYQPDTFYRLEANEDYFLGAPTVPEIVLPIIGDNTAMFTALQVGEIDAMTEYVSPELIDQFEADERIQLISGPGLTTTLLQFNHEIEPFRDREFRRAIAMAIDREQLVDRVLLGQGDLGSMGFFHPATPFFNEDARGTFDREQAEEILDAAGYEYDGDERTMQDGSPFDLDMLVYSDNPLRIRGAELIAADLAQVGIPVSVQTLDSTTVDSLVWPGFDVQSGRDFDLAMWGWSAASQLGPTQIRRLFHGDLSIGSLNIGAFSSDEFDARSDDLLTAADPGERDDIVRDLQAIVADEAPIVPLYYQQVTNAYDPDVYDGWTVQVGKGIITKLSFIPGYAGGISGDADAPAAEGEEPDEADGEEAEEADGEEPAGEEPGEAAAADDDDAGGGAMTTLIIILAVLAVLIIGAVLISRRKSEPASD